MVVPFSQWYLPWLWKIWDLTNEMMMNRQWIFRARLNVMIATIALNINYPKYQMYSIVYTVYFMIMTIALIASNINYLKYQMYSIHSIFHDRDYSVNSVKHKLPQIIPDVQYTLNDTHTCEVQCNNTHFHLQSSKDQRRRPPLRCSHSRIPYHSAETNRKVQFMK